MLAVAASSHYVCLVAKYLCKGGADRSANEDLHELGLQRGIVVNDANSFAAILSMKIIPYKINICLRRPHLMVDGGVSTNVMR
jgi:hypothetical protein